VKNLSNFDVKEKWYVRIVGVLFVSQVVFLPSVYCMITEVCDMKESYFLVRQSIRNNTKKSTRHFIYLFESSTWV